MKKIQNIKHIFIIIFIVFFLISVGFFGFLKNFLIPANYALIYRTGEQTQNQESKKSWQDYIYKHTFEPSKNIVVITIDEKTLNHYSGNQIASAEYSTLTIPKSDYTKVMKTLIDAGVKWVGFDIIFQNRDRDEEEFVKILLEHGNTAIASYKPAIKNGDNSQCQQDVDSEIITCVGTPRSSYRTVPWATIDMGAHDKNLANESRPLGYNLSKQDYPHQFQAKFGDENTTENQIIYTLPVEILKNENIPGVRKILSLPYDSQLIQPYFNSEHNDHASGLPYAEFSFIDILTKWEYYTDRLKDAYVFIGESGTHLHDRVRSPASNEMIAGVYTHAFLLDSILQNKIFTKISDQTMIIIVAILTIIFVNIYFFSPKFFSPIIAIISIIATIFVARYIFDKNFLVVDISPLLMATSIVSYPLTYIYKFFIVEKDKRLIMNTFSRYISPEVVKQIDAQQIEATLGGEKKELSILFSDIAGFTTISEKLDTKELFVVMTKYLSEMTEVLVDNKWTLDKYIGDAVMGFFGAPVDDDFHAVNACKTALAMRAKRDDFNEWLVSKWHEKIDFRVGIATGEVLVGNIGSERQFNYTVLGDVVNLASRLEWTGKEYGVNIIIASSTKMASGNGFLVRELDYIAVKWKNEGVRIYELVGALGDDIDMTPYTTYESALRLYRDGKYMDAGRIWESLAATDKPSEIMMHRCVALIKWEMSLENGIYKMTHK